VIVLVSNFRFYSHIFSAFFLQRLHCIFISVLRCCESSSVLWFYHGAPGLISRDSLRTAGSVGVLMHVNVTVNCVSSRCYETPA
jgi:hypothetical protein